MNSKDFIKKPLDHIDLSILRILQKNGRMQNLALSKKVSLSPGPCLIRVRKLKKDGYIRHYRAELNAEKLGFSLLAYIEITIPYMTPTKYDTFKKAIDTIPEIEECHMLAGRCDYLIKVRCRDINSYRKLLNEKILVIASISQARTFIVMEQVKHVNELNI